MQKLWDCTEEVWLPFRCHKKCGIRKHELGERVKQFPTALHQLCDHSDFAQLRERMTRDWFIEGIVHAQLLPTPQMDAALTFQTSLAKAGLKETDPR